MPRTARKLRTQCPHCSYIYLLGAVDSSINSRRTQVHRSNVNKYAFAAMHKNYRSLCQSAWCMYTYVFILQNKTKIALGKLLSGPTAIVIFRSMYICTQIHVIYCIRYNSWMQFKFIFSAHLLQRNCKHYGYLCCISGKLENLVLKVNLWR